MFKHIFLDTNVIADIYDSSRPSHAHSRKVISSLIGDENVTLYTSCDIITTLYYILSKRGKREALNAILDINDFCNVIEFGNKEVLQSCTLMLDNDRYCDLEDTIQHIMAKKSSCDLILSNDARFASEDIELLTTAEFVERYL